MSVEQAGEKGSQGGGCGMSGRKSEGIVRGGGQRELEVAKGRMVERSPVGSCRGRGCRDLGRERGVVDISNSEGGWNKGRSSDL